MSTWHFFKNNPQYPILRNDQSDFDDDGEDANDGGDGWDDGEYAEWQMIAIAMLMVMMIGREEGLDFLRDFFWQIFIMQIPNNTRQCPTVLNNNTHPMILNNIQHNSNIVFSI